jgi:hypothetical protein
MQTQWLKKMQGETYDGRQLRSLFAYLEHKILGDSCVAWQGPCSVGFDHMVDGEDLLAKAEIAGSDMVHFIIEIFDQNLMSGVLLQRLFASIISDVLTEISPVKDLHLSRSGDDLYYKKRKLSISIATRSPVSTMLHFAVNVSNEGTPVETACLKDLKVDPKRFADKCLAALRSEYMDCIVATRKVRPVS